MSTDPIKHVVVLMLENHSFDQMLGAFKSVFPDLEGVDLASPRSNSDRDGRVYTQAETTAINVSPDPMHELANVLHQLENGNGNFVGRPGRADHQVDRKRSHDDWLTNPPSAEQPETGNKVLAFW